MGFPELALMQALATEAQGVFRARVARFNDSDGLVLRAPDGRELTSDYLEQAAASGFAVDDEVLALQTDALGLRPIVIGRIAAAGSVAAAPTYLSLRAAQSVRLECGEASIELRADGAVLVRGEDIVFRAKGTQRIRAGSVAIN